MSQLKLTADILSAALEGFEAQKNRINARIAEIRPMLEDGPKVHLGPSDTAKPKRRISARSPSQNGESPTVAVEED
jgi:hypothetical protein